MMKWRELPEGIVILSGHMRQAPNLNGAGMQVLATNHYSADPAEIAAEIKAQNPTLFS